MIRIAREQFTNALTRARIWCSNYVGIHTAHDHGPQENQMYLLQFKKNTRQPLLIHDSARAFAINRKKKRTLPIIFVTAAAVVALRLLMR